MPVSKALLVLALTVAALTGGCTPGPTGPPGTPTGSTPDPAGGAAAPGGVVEVETYGTAAVHPYQKAANAPAYFAVHAVQRVDTATVVYLSVGYTDPSVDDASPIELSELAVPPSRFVGGSALTSTRLLDPASRTVLATLPVPANPRPTPFSSPLGAFPDEPGVMAVVYAVLPALPDDVEAVDVQLGFGAIIPDVPVADGLLTPTVADDLVPLGTGWPAIDPAALAAPDDPAASTYRLSVVTEAIDGSRVTVETPEQVAIDLSADVLFAFDSADLAADARQRVVTLAAEVSERAAPGGLGVVGHTDSDGSDAYNDDLSRRRAEAVAAALTPALTTPGLRPSVDGRGEREPVADNATVEGKQANRRVSITFAVTPP